MAKKKTKKTKAKVKVIRRKPKPKAAPVLDVATALVAAKRGISPEAIAMSKSSRARKTMSVELFQPVKPPTGVLPEGKTIAMDSACAPGSVAWAGAGAGIGLNFAWNEGIAFMGYNYLAVLAQIPEYRLVSEVIATEMTRKWIKIKAADAAPGEDDGDELDNDEQTGDQSDLLADKKPGALTNDGAPLVKPTAPPTDKDATVSEEADADPAAADPNAAVADPAVADPTDPNADPSDPNAPTPEDDAASQLADLKAAKVKEVEAEFERLSVRDAFTKVAVHDGFFGRGHIYIDTGDTDNRDELILPIGDGNEFTQKKYQPGFLKALRVVEPVWAYPSNYNANDPLKPDWYNPQRWYVMSKDLDKSRFLTFVGREVPDLMKAQFSFGGLSLTQMIKPYVDNWLETRQSVNDLIQAFSTMVLSTDMQDVLSGGPSTGLFTRVDMFNDTRDNRGTFVLNKDTEEMTNIAVPLGTLDHLQAQAQEHIASVARIPLVKLTGISPTGLNASSEGEIRAFYDTIHAQQEKFFTPNLTTIFKLVQINLWGEVDEDLSFDYEPLWELDEAALASMRKEEADTHKVYVDMGVVDPLEVRKAVASEEDSPYSGLDPNDLPEPPPPPVMPPGMGGGGDPDGSPVDAPPAAPGDPQTDDQQ